MQTRRPLSKAAQLTVVGLVLAAIGIGIQVVSGVDYPIPPPGAVSMLLLAGLLVWGPSEGVWRWLAILPVLFALWIIIAGFFADPGWDQVTDPDNAGAFGGIVLQILGLIVTIVAGTGMLRDELGSDSSARPRPRPST